MTHDVHFDGLVGPTHNYAGLSLGNKASTRHKGDQSNPREAALQGLKKMKLLADLGVPQFILPPQERPNRPFLRLLGIDSPEKAPPSLLIPALSASSMWAANSFVGAPSSDTQDGRVHIQVANLGWELHRSHEAFGTFHFLEKCLFPHPFVFKIHPPLPSSLFFSDEGGANHIRLVDKKGEGVHLFVYGREALRPTLPTSTRFPARQSLEASEATARQLQVFDRSLFVQQNPTAIDSGVFHNDVISFGGGSLLIAHEKGFLDQKTLLPLEEKGIEIKWIKESEMSLQEAVSTYFFNSQLFLLPQGGYGLIVPMEVLLEKKVKERLDRLIEETPAIKALFSINLNESMKNGGGPACLRNHLLLSDKELQSLPSSLKLTDTLYESLVNWVYAHYRDNLKPADLFDPLLWEESNHALDELTSLLGLGAFYDFQS